MLQSPKLQSVLLPGDEIELKCIEKIPEGRYGVEPNINARRISQPTEWLQPQVIEIKNETVVTKNLSDLHHYEQYQFNIKEKNNISLDVYKQVL